MCVICHLILHLIKKFSFLNILTWLPDKLHVLFSVLVRNHIQHYVLTRNLQRHLEWIHSTAKADCVRCITIVSQIVINVRITCATGRSSEKLKCIKKHKKTHFINLLRWEKINKKIQENHVRKTCEKTRIIWNIQNKGFFEWDSFIRMYRCFRVLLFEFHYYLSFFYEILLIHFFYMFLEQIWNILWKMIINSFINLNWQTMHGIQFM